MASEQSIPISAASSENSGSFVAPTPQNTPLNAAPISLGLSRPTVPDIPEGEDGDDDEDSEGEQNAAIRAKMLDMVQGKLAGLLGKSSGYVESLPLAVKRRVEGLKGVQVEYSKIEAEYKKEVAELDKKVSPLANFTIFISGVDSLDLIYVQSTYNAIIPSSKGAMPF